MSNTINSLSTQELTAKVEQSLGKTEQIEQTSDSKQVVNTEIATLPVKVSSAPKLNKETALEGGVTKSASVTIGADNLVYANVRVSSEQGNAIMIKDDGLFANQQEQAASVNLAGGESESNVVTIQDGVVKASTKISPQAGNKLSLKQDGLYVEESSAGVSAVEVQQMIENGKSDVVLREFSGVKFTYAENALVISVGGVDKIKISSQGVDFFV